MAAYIECPRLCLERALELELITKSDYLWMKKKKFGVMATSHECLQDMRLRQKDLNIVRTPEPTSEEVTDWKNIFEFLLNLPSPESIKAKYNLLISHDQEWY